MRDRINLNPIFMQPPAQTDKMQSYPLAYILEGQFSSYFDGKPIPLKEIEDSEKTFGLAGKDRVTGRNVTLTRFKKNVI